MTAMRAVMLEVDEHLLAERRRRGADRRDEMWDGVLHMVPPASGPHQRLEAQLLVLLAPLIEERGLELSPETGLFRAADDYRVPDLMVYPPEVTSERGVDGAPLLVIEIRSPGDESIDKLPWYFERGTAEVLIIDRDSLVVDLYRPEGAVAPGPDGWVVLATLPLRLQGGDGLLVVETPAGRTVLPRR
jgi:Uma2 family endonuclease